MPGPGGEVWIDFGGYKAGVARPSGDSMRWMARPFRRLAEVGDLHAIRPEGDSLVWFGGSDALIRYDRRRQPYGGHAQSFRTLIRGVHTRDDSLYGGDSGTATLPAAVGPDVDALHFQFGTTSYEQIDGPTSNWDRPRQYRWRLIGVDDEWTDWTTEPRADYTSLPPGTHTLHVQARNLYQVVGQEAGFSFAVLPPWYRTWWAYGGYGLLAFGLVAGAVRWRTRRLRRRQEHLETAVAERTEEIERQKDQLAKQAERLQELDDAKSRFFANITHEFRTPLTLIRGPVQQVRRDLERGRLEPVSDEAEANVEQLSIVERNVDRLQRLIDQVLGLARLEAGTYELDLRPTDLETGVKRLAREFEPLAERADLDLTVKIDGSTSELAGETGGEEPLFVDREALEHILSNLLSNAIKFTPSGGSVEVVLVEQAEGAEIVIRDTGTGIPEEKQEAIFERFAQVDDTATREQEGAGIGLAFTKDLVDLHGGTIHLHSVEGEGTTVTVRLPRGTDHLSDDQGAALPRSDEQASAGSPQKEEGASRGGSASKDEPETEAIPVIMVTARAETQDEVSGLKIGANDYVTKPFDADVLRQRVGGVLTLQQRLRRHLEAELRDGADEDAEEATPDGREQSEIERRARTIIREHLTESDFKVSDLAEELAMSRSTLYRKLKAEAETTPSTLMRRRPRGSSATANQLRRSPTPWATSGCPTSATSSSGIPAPGPAQSSSRSPRCARDPGRQVLSSRIRFPTPTHSGGAVYLTLGVN